MYCVLISKRRYKPISRKEIAMFVHQTELFKEMNQAFMDKLNKITVTKDYDKGAFIFKVGEPAHHFYILLQGRVRMTIGETRHTVTIANNPGEAFGWSCLVGFDSYTATAECLMPCKLVRIEKEPLLALLENDPASGMVFFRGLASTIGQRLVNTYNVLLTGQSKEDPPSYG
jgi:CRP-like cAMP-binding protein